MKKLRKPAFRIALILSALHAAQAQTATDPVQNRSFEIVDPSNASLAKSWQVLGNPYTRTALPGAWDQSYVLRLTSGAGAVQIIPFNQTVAAPIRISVRVKGDAIADVSTDKVGASLDCKVNFSDGTAAWCPLTAKTKLVGTFDWTWIGFNTRNLSSSTSPITTIELRLKNGAPSGTAWFDDVHAEIFKPTTNGLVAFRFDDSFLSTYTKAFPLLRSYGFVGTEAAVTSYMITDPANSDGIHMSVAQHKELYQNGWSILSHTRTHRDLTTLSIVELNDELYWSHKQLVDYGFAVRGIAYPFGSYNGRVNIQTALERYGGYRYEFATTSDEDINPQGVFPSNIRVMHIVSSTTVHDVRAALQTADETNSLVVFLIHEIDNPNGIYTVTSTTFADMVQEVKQSGLRVVTVDEGVRLITAKQ